MGLMLCFLRVLKPNAGPKKPREHMVRTFDLGVWGGDSSLGRGRTSRSCSVRSCSSGSLSHVS